MQTVFLSIILLIAFYIFINSSFSGRFSLRISKWFEVLIEKNKNESIHELEEEKKIDIPLK